MTLCCSGWVKRCALYLQLYPALFIMACTCQELLCNDSFPTMRPTTNVHAPSPPIWRSYEASRWLITVNCFIFAQTWSWMIDNALVNHNEEYCRYSVSAGLCKRSAMIQTQEYKYTNPNTQMTDNVIVMRVYQAWSVSGAPRSREPPRGAQKLTNISLQVTQR